MPDRTARILLWGGTMLAAACGLTVVAAAIFSPIRPVVHSQPKEQPLAIAAPHTQRDQIPLAESDFTSIWNKPLQRPIVDPPPPIVAQPAPPPEPPKPKPIVVAPPVRLEAKLVGTLVGTAGIDSRAWIEVNGKQQMVGLGDLLKSHPGNPTIKEIRDRSVIVELATESHKLTLVEPAFLTNVAADPQRDDLNVN